MSDWTKKFIADESGAVTVDWVTLAAALVGLSIAVMMTVSDGMDNLTSDLDATMTGHLISTTF